MITYKWVIPALNCIVSQDGLSNVVKGIHWRYQGTDENNNMSDLFGYQEIGAVDPENFTPYSALTIEVTSGWLEGLLDISEMETEIAKKISEKADPVEVILPLPMPNINNSI
jgi:hypothetical protein